MKESTGVDISKDGYRWKDDSGPNAGSDKVIAKGASILKKQAPEVFNALVSDKDNPTDVSDSDMVRGQAASEDGSNLPDSSVNVKVNGRRVGYVDTDKGAWVKEATKLINSIDNSLNKLV